MNDRIWNHARIIGAFALAMLSACAKSTPPLPVLPATESELGLSRIGIHVTFGNHVGTMGVTGPRCRTGDKGKHEGDDRILVRNYGAEDRVCEHAQRTVAIVPAECIVSAHEEGSFHISRDCRGSYKVRASVVDRVCSKKETTTGDRVGLEMCAGDRFNAEPIMFDPQLLGRGNSFSRFCTGVIIGPGLVATSRHCTPKDLRTVRIVRNLLDIGQTIKEGDVASNIVSSYEVDGTQDIALLDVGEAFDKMPLIALRRDVVPFEEIYAIGHPLGLASTVSGCALAYTRAAPGGFRANVDTVPGSSGSPVFAASDGALLGILRRDGAGLEDYSVEGDPKCCRIEQEDSFVFAATISRISDEMLNLIHSRYGEPRHDHHQDDSPDH